MLQTVCKSELNWRSYSHLKATAPSWKGISHHPFSDAKISHHLSLMWKFHITLFHLRNFRSHLSQMRKFLHHLFLMQNFHNTIHYLRNVIFRYFTPTLLDFYLKIFGVIIYSLLIISWKVFKIFRISN